MELFSRRSFLVKLGKGTAAVAVLGPMTVACGSDTGGADDTAVASPSTTSTPPTSAVGSTSTAVVGSSTTSGSASVGSGGSRWERVAMTNVSAYILVRDSKAVIVDTGHAGLIEDIDAGLQRVGVGWGDVGDVILTHMHGDHIGGLPAVMDRATAATAHAGEPDIEAMRSPRPISVVADGDEVFGLDIIGTPGHTPGHVCVLDRSAGILVAGDALIGSDGGISGPNPRFSSDMNEANASVVKLAGLDYSTILVGHGDPVTSNGSTLVAELSATL